MVGSKRRRQGSGPQTQFEPVVFIEKLIGAVNVASEAKALIINAPIDFRPLSFWFVIVEFQHDGFGADSLDSSLPIVADHGRNLGRTGSMFMTGISLLYEPNAPSRERIAYFVTL